MTIEEKFTEAFRFLRRYETILLLRAWGWIMIAIGLVHFLTSWIVKIYLFYFLSQIVDDDSGIAWHLTHNIQLVIIVALLFLIAGIMIITYRSIIKTKIENMEVVAVRIRQFGLALIFLFILTFFNFFIWALADFVQFYMSDLPLHPFLLLFLAYANVPLYIVEMIAIFFTYLVLRRVITDYDFKEVLLLGYFLLVLSVIEICWRWILLGILLPSLPIDVGFHILGPLYGSYFMLGLAPMIAYLLSGVTSLIRADQLLKGNMSE